MSHAEVVALLETAALTPGLLRRLASERSAEAFAFRAHLAVCEECRREAHAWEAVDESLAAATPGAMGAPLGLRGRVLASVVATGVARGASAATGPAAPAPAAPVAAASAATAASPAPAASAARAAAPPAAQPSSPPLAAPPGPEQAPTRDPRRGLRVLRGGAEEGQGFRLFLAVAAAAVFLFFLGAAVAGPLGLVPPASQPPDLTGRVELEKVAGRLADLLQQPGATVAPLADQDGEPAGAVVLGPPDTRMLGVVTRALAPLGGDLRYVCLLEREGERYQVGYMRFAGDPAAEGDVAYWVGPLSDEVPPDAGQPGDRFLVYVDGDTGGEPLLSTAF